MTLNDKFNELVKNKKKPNSDLVKRKTFLTKLEGLFDISCADAEHKINRDRLREGEDKEEDLTFLAD